MGEEDDPYAHAAKGKLKLKSDNSIKKKKKKVKDLLEKVAKTIEEEAKELPKQEKRTNAELAFKKMQEKMQHQRILEKATMTHKERVEKFNQHLDSLTEHFDIPKVSWTK
ncbi:hypothetical protein MML48_3g00009152 [Holotrichia oblita]|uniref:Uncharacterized protein n=1 Tax=Holotrichia oblita TaxID=644536 RepID=A0ACB9TC09_HOLOL|nr:hypothetical protein MML48_3g00009152 [Holotrichia oblita]